MCRNDLILLTEDVPTFYLLPPTLFAPEQQQNYGEVEFPIYFNFFIKKAFANPEHKVMLIGDSDHLDRVQIAFRESIFGPDKENIFLNEELESEKKYGYITDLKLEQSVISGERMPLSHYAEFKPFSEYGVVEIKRIPKGNFGVVVTTNSTKGSAEEVTVTIVNTKGLLQFYEGNTHKASIDSNIFLNRSHNVLSTHVSASLPTLDLPKSRISDDDRNLFTFVPPTFGVTFLGTSHGFDATGNTTGFIIWINGSGILVDPPLNSIEYLKANGVKMSFVNKVILTHCHR